MIEKLIDSIDILRRKIQFNMDLIHQNENKIYSILDEPVSATRTEKLEKRFKFNKKKIAENNDTLRLQQTVMEYLERYHESIKEVLLPNSSNKVEVNKEDIVSHYNDINQEEYFQLTADGVIEFNEHHPYYTNEKFLERLLNHHMNIENYEMCSVIVNIQNKISV